MTASAMTSDVATIDLQALHEYIGKRLAQPNFANARSIRNALDRACLRQANRLFAAAISVTRDALQTISAPDIRASRDFEGE